MMPSPKRLERMLNLNRGPEDRLKAEVLNFGTMGVATRDEVSIVARALDHNPDLILLEITLT